MFGKLKLLRKINILKEDKEKLQEQVVQLKSTKKIEEEEIKHLVRLKEEKMEVTFERRQLTLDKEHQKKMHNLQTDYNDKIQARLEKEVDRMKGMYGEVLKRLPDVNVRLKGDV